MTFFMPVSITAMACVSKISSMVQSSYLGDVLPKGYLVIKRLHDSLPNCVVDLPLRVNGFGGAMPIEEEEYSPVVEVSVKVPAKSIPSSSQVADAFWNKGLQPVEDSEITLDSDVAEAGKKKKKVKKRVKTSVASLKGNAIDDIFGSL
jgi:hypothetical protein